MTDKQVLDAIRRIRAAHTHDPDITAIVTRMCRNAGVLDLGHLAREHPDVVLALADEIDSMTNQLDHDNIVFEDLG